MDGVSAQSKREKKPKESPTNNMNVIKINQKNGNLYKPQIYDTDSD